MDNTKYVQAPTMYLAGSGVIIGATSITVTSLVDIYGNVLTMTDFGTKGFITLEPDTNNEEAATFTGITANANGTYTFTGVKTIIAKDPYTETSGLVRQHSGGTKVVVTDNVGFWNTFANKTNDETITGIWTAPTGGTGAQIATATDIANAVIGASGTATNTTFGTVKLSVAAASVPNPIAVGDNDTRVPTQGENDALVGTSGTPSTTNKYVTNDDTDTAATASKVARRLAGGNLTVVTETPGNNTTNAASTAFVTAAVATVTPVGFQSLPYIASANLGYADLRSTSETDGSAMYTVSGTSATQFYITRWQKDTNTGVYFETHQVQLVPANTPDRFSIAVVGSFVYVISKDAGAVRLVTRYASADLTGVTTMTLSGTTFADGNAAFSDGTFLYIFESSSVFRKYSISGTTYTNVTTITYTSAGNVNNGAAICDGTSVWMCDSATTSAPINKYPVAGGASTASVTRTITNPYPNPVAQLKYIFVKSGIIGIIQTYVATNATVNVGTVINLYPITQP